VRHIACREISLYGLHSYGRAKRPPPAQNVILDYIFVAGIIDLTSNTFRNWPQATEFGQISKITQNNDH